MTSVEIESIKVNFLSVFGQVLPKCEWPVPRPTIVKNSFSGKLPSKFSAEALVELVQILFTMSTFPTLYKQG